MSILVAPNGSPAVRGYRFLKVPVEYRHYEGEVGPELVHWLGEHGLEWDAFWTGAYSNEAQAIAAMFQERGVPVIVDVDDYFSEVPTGNQAHISWYGNKKKMYGEMLANADRRVASTPFLAETYGCKVAPNFVTNEEWNFPARQRNDDSVVLLHCGSVNRAEDYIARKKSFQRFLEEPNTKIVFMGWMPAWAKDYEPGRVVFCRWVEYDKYCQMMRWLAPDILVSPLEHNKFNLAKSNIKWLESAMVGAAFVGERWGEYARTVQEGVTGVLADGEDEWTEALVSLARDSQRRKHLAAEAESVVKSQWVWDAVKQDWLTALGVS